MIGVDTNVLVRYFAQDDGVQSPIASRFIEALTPDEPGYVSAVVLAELSWVLSRVYRSPREIIARTVETLLRARELVVENAEAAYHALATYQTTKVEFADALIAHSDRLAGCAETVTFDRAASAGGGMRLLS